MRFLCLLFLLAFLAAIGIFAWQNQYDVTVTFLQWGYTGKLALVVGAAYLLGMLSGWTVVGMLRRSFRRAATIVEAPRQNAPAAW